MPRMNGERLKTPVQRAITPIYTHLLHHYNNMGLSLNIDKYPCPAE